VCRASDDTLTRGIPGTYTRAVTGMYSESVLLKADGSYVFTFQFDIGSDQEKGTWAVRDSVLVLSPQKRGETRKTWPSQFRILTIDHDLALSVIETETEAQPEDSPMRLFRPKKKKANQTAQTTPGLRPSVSDL
jgi:hypothetical protein